MTAPFYTKKIKYFTQNLEGKDFVIGDIHGRYDLVEKALEKANFNKKKDRLFCVGDLIDRGVYSEQVDDFLAEPYVHAIRGNHEDMLLELYADGQEPAEALLEVYAMKIGLFWWLDLSKSKKMNILNKLKQLPLVMEIDTFRGSVGLIHADVPLGMNWSEFKVAVNSNNFHVIQESLWGRKRIFQDSQEGVKGVGRVYVGHTVQEKIKKFGNVVAIDTGAVFNEHLTMVGLECSTEIINKVEKPTDNIQIIESEKVLLPFTSSPSYM